MQYYINPMWFYWLRVFDMIENVCLFLSGGIGTVVLVSLALYIIFYCFCGDELFCAEDRKRTKRFLEKFWILSLLCTICYALIPDEKTIIEMMIAKQATVYNDQNLLDAIKNAADYVIHAIQNAK